MAGEFNITQILNGTKYICRENTHGSSYSKPFSSGKGSIPSSKTSVKLKNKNLECIKDQTYNMIEEIFDNFVKHPMAIHFKILTIILFVVGISLTMLLLIKLYFFVKRPFSRALSNIKNKLQKNNRNMDVVEFNDL
ncbi:hypothetical protein H311_01016 [Anncaliia algerae PRA109]|nr:hypothetical protein H311_01016 [Anncaliia algerae PRA109]